MHSYIDIANWCRRELIYRSTLAKTPHIGSGLSVIDILVSIYFGLIDSEKLKLGSVDRDIVILSKGHAALAQYIILRRLGILTGDDLDSFAKPGSLLEEHPSPSIAGIEAATGSLGHGLPIACGTALGQLRRGFSSKTFVVLSDGECNEGSTWEAAMFASSKKLHNLVAFVDFNKWQATGRSEQVLGLSGLANMWRSFGWQTLEVDGHSVGAILEAVNENAEACMPTMLICHTVKGKGVSFMEDDNNWHYRIPNQEELDRALEELRGA